MPNELYFIPIIEKALRQKDAKRALQNAFIEIINLGKQPSYKEGFTQFQRFMEEISQNISLKEISGNLEDNLKPFIDLIMSQPDWKRQYDELISDFQIKYNLELQLEKNNELLWKKLIAQETFSTTIKNIVPGDYIVKLNTGRILWEDTLSEKDLLWAKAYPEKPIDLAADTGIEIRKPTKEFSLLNSEIIIKVFPGIESGYMKIEKKTMDKV